MKQIEAALAQLPPFAPRRIERMAAVDAGRVFLGLPYNESNNFVCLDAREKPNGHLNCHGLFFAWAQHLGLVDANVWRALQNAFSIAGVGPTLHAYMMRETRETKIALPGDWLLFRWKQASPYSHTEAGAIRRGKHHVALLSDSAKGPCGRIIHAVDTDANANGGTFEHDLIERDHAQIHLVRTLPQFID